MGYGVRPVCFTVFGAFNALQYRLQPSSHYENDAIAWPIVCRSKLGSILNCNTTRCAGTYVNQAAAALEGQHRVIHCGIYRGEGLFYGGASDQLAIVHGLDHVASGPGIEVDKSGAHVLSQHTDASFAARSPHCCLGQRRTFMAVAKENVCARAE